MIKLYSLFKVILILLPMLLSAQSQPILQWEYHNISCDFNSGMADRLDLEGNPMNGITVFLSTAQISCSNSYLQSRGIANQAARDIGGAWIIIEFPSNEIRDYAIGEFWAIMSYWVVGPDYGYDTGYLGTAGLTSIDSVNEKIVSGWINFDVYTGSKASGSFTVPLCLMNTKSTPYGQNSGTPYKFRLSQNIPNPFNPLTKIEFTLPKCEFVDLEVYNTLGQKIRNLLNKQLPAGSHLVEFDASGLPSGLYFYRLRAGNSCKVRKMILQQ